MKCWEAISLGHTLCGEDETTFFSLTGNCGCGIGSAIAAMGEIETYRRAVVTTWLYSGIDWLEEKWPWTATPTSTSLGRELGLEPGGNISEAISHAHVCGMPRMKIADILSRHEPDWSTHEPPENPLRREREGADVNFAGGVRP